MKQLTFAISEELFDEISNELSNELMAKWFKEAIYNQNLKDDNLEELSHVHPQIHFRGIEDAKERV